MSGATKSLASKKSKLGMFLVAAPIGTILFLLLAWWIAGNMAYINNPPTKALIDTDGPYFAIVALAWLAIVPVFFLSFISIPVGIILIIRSKRATN